MALLSAYIKSLNESGFCFPRSALRALGLLNPRFLGSHLAHSLLLLLRVLGSRIACRTKRKKLSSRFRSALAPAPRTALDAPVLLRSAFCVLRSAFSHPRFLGSHLAHSPPTCSAPLRVFAS